MALQPTGPATPPTTAMGLLRTDLEIQLTTAMELLHTDLEILCTTVGKFCGLPDRMVLCKY